MKSVATPASKAKIDLSTANQCLLMLIFAALMSLAFLEVDYYYFAWFAFVPLLFALDGASLFKTYVLSLIAGLCAYSSGMYWVVDFAQISKGLSLADSLGLAFIYWLYCGHHIALMMVLFKWLKRRVSLSEFLLFPLVVASFTSAYPMLFAMRLGDSQATFLIALQAIEFVGVHGLDVIIALVNVLIFRICHSAFFSISEFKRSAKLPWLISIGVVISWFAYGAIQFTAWDADIEQWGTVKIGIVQPNEIPKVGKRLVYSGYSQAYPPEMEMTERLSAAGAAIVIWPEAQVKGYLDNKRVKQAFQAQVKSLGSALLFQDTASIRDSQTGNIQTQFNSAIMLDSEGEQTGLYRKIKRIPFGEYVPWFGDESMAKNSITNFFGEFFIELSAGQIHESFEHQKLNFIPLICYETTFPDFVGQAVKDTHEQRNNDKASVLVALTNDGWFGSTHQPYQHIMPSILRAVENRLPLIHVANNGPSIVAMPSGKVIFTSDFQQAAAYLIDLPNSSEAQGSFYSRYPGLFDRLMYIVLGFTILLALFRSLKSTVKTKPDQEISDH